MNFKIGDKVKINGDNLVAFDEWDDDDVDMTNSWISNDEILHITKINKIVGHGNLEIYVEDDEENCCDTGFYIKELIHIAGDWDD